MRSLHDHCLYRSRWLLVSLVLAVLVCLTLTSCCHKVLTPSKNEPAKLPYKVDGASDRAIMKMQARFNKSGVRVIVQGQNYLVSIPSVALFNDQTPALTWRSYAVLNAVVCYLKQFRKVAVTVTAYTTPYVSVPREQALALARARAVGDYFWSQGIDSRFMFTQRLGRDKPIVATGQTQDSSPNSRIEITFREAVI